MSFAYLKCSLEEERLIKTLFKSYNKLIRPVRNSSDYVIITMDLVLLQLINVYEKEQIMKTNVWINLKWTDFQLNWTTNDFKVGSIRVPYERVWTPDIVLFNNADGNYEASYKPNVLVYGDTQDTPDSTNILWIPPAIYKSSCTIDVKYFPFDEQKCEMRFGSWTFDAHQVRLRREKKMVNLEDYLPSGTWDVIEAPGTDFSDGNRMELVYTFKIRRKTLFYTVNLIIPTVLISFLSIFVFYLPTDEGEKMTLCISILLALVVFLLLVSKILPPTSMVIPLISKYLIFTLMMNIITILNTVIIINWNYRTPRTHNMPKWVRIVFINFLPTVLRMKRPEQDESTNKNDESNETSSTDKEIKIDVKSNHIRVYNSNNNNNMLRKENSNEEKHENFLKIVPINNKNSISRNYLTDDEDLVKQQRKSKNDSSRHSTLSKSNYNEVCSINSSHTNKHDISIPIISSNLDYYPTTPSHQQQYSLFGNNNDYKTNHLNPSTARPKQQQHKNLDKLVANLKTSKRQHLNAEYQSPMSIKSNHIRLKLYTDVDELRDDDLMDENRNRLLTLSATDSICTTPQKTKYRHHHHHHHNHHRHHRNQQNQHQHDNLVNFNQMQTASDSSSKHSHSKSSNRLYKNNSNNSNNLKEVKSLPFHTLSPNGSSSLIRRGISSHSRRQNFSQTQTRSLEYALDDAVSSEDDRPIEFSQEIMEAADKVTYITNHIKSENYYEEMRDDWKYVALVIDRLLLIIFFSVTVLGTALILFNAPHIFQFVDQQEILSDLIKKNKES